MNRNIMLSEIDNPSIIWDVIIIGGGATGIGAALDAASRGYKTLLVEQSDFGKSTSSKSTKLVHGGVRYLQQGNFSLVFEALKERGVLKRNAPHLVKDFTFIVPVYSWWKFLFYGIGLKLYDLLAGKESFGTSKFLSKKETIRKISTIETKGLRGGILYHDGQFNDTRLLINLGQTAIQHGAVILNYMKMTSLIHEQSLIKGVVVEDQETNKKYKLKAKAVINATGVFSDNIRKMDNEEVEPIMTSSQGVHIVLDKKFLPGDSAIMVPRTDDGRVLFAVPWLNKIIVGTTDTPVKDYSLEPLAFDDEIEFLLTHVTRYLISRPTINDIKSVFVGLRPLVMDTRKSKTSSISREHIINISPSGLLSIAGGKWTTYRKMAEDVVDKAIVIGNLNKQSSLTHKLHIYGYHKNSSEFGIFEQYGSEVPILQKLLDEHVSYRNKLHSNYPYLEGEVIWAVRNEMARTVEDFLSRRTRLLLLDVKAAVSIAGKVAKLMATELNFNNEWEESQLNSFTKLAKGYMCEKSNKENK